jgi:hypothetical protein
MKSKDEEERKGVLETIAGIQPVAQAALDEFKKEMEDNVIPEIVRVVQMRLVWAAESRLRQLKY